MTAELVSTVHDYLRIPLRKVDRVEANRHRAGRGSSLVRAPIVRYQASAQVLVNRALALSSVAIGLGKSPADTRVHFVFVVVPAWTATALSARRWVRVGLAAAFR